MKRFYLRYYQEDIKLRRSVAVLPWGHNLLLLNNDLSSEHILFYANEVTEFQYLLPQNKLETMITNEIKKRNMK